MSSNIRPFSVAPPVRLNEVFAGLSYALDLTEGQRPGHSVRTTLIGMKLAEVIGLPSDQRESLLHALLLKDLGCSSNSARFAAIFGHDDHELKATLATINWSNALHSFRFVARNVAPGHFWMTRVWRILGVLARGAQGARDVVRTRCERGADIARLLNLSDATAHAIRTIDEHWDGKGQPYDMAGDEIPLLGRIVGLAQTFEVFFSTSGITAAYDMSRVRRGRWFDPTLVDALCSVERDTTFWNALSNGRELDSLGHFSHHERTTSATIDQLDNVAEAFARVIDAKSPWTYKHSNGVADLSVAIARRLGFGEQDVRAIRQGAWLHDLGKLGVSNLILDKPGRLDARELHVMRQHPANTAAVLSRVSCFAPLATFAAAHHEKLDGSGYHRGLPAHMLTLEARILCIADICDALRASRPYRDGLPTERVLEIMGREVGTALDPDCFHALVDVLHDNHVSDGPDMPAAHVVNALAEDYSQAA